MFITPSASAIRRIAEGADQQGHVAVPIRRPQNEVDGDDRIEAFDGAAVEVAADIEGQPPGTGVGVDVAQRWNAAVAVGLSRERLDPVRALLPEQPDGDSGGRPAERRDEEVRGERHRRTRWSRSRVMVRGT